MPRQYTRNLRKGFKEVPAPPEFKPAGPFRTEQDGQHSNLIFDANGIAILRVRSGADAGRIAEWVTKVMNKEHYTQEQIARTKAIFEKPMEVIK